MSSSPGSGKTKALIGLRRSLFFVSLPFFMLYLLLPVYGKEIGASVVEIGLFFSAFSLMTLLMRPLLGWGLDRFGRRPFLIVGLAGYAATWAAFAFIDQVWGIIVARILQGVSSSFVWLTAYTIVADLAGEGGRGRAFGSVTQASSLGAIVVTGLCFLGTVASGGFLSSEEPMPIAVLRLHQIVLVLTVLSSGAMLYLMLGAI